MMEHFAFNVHNWDMILRLLVATVLGGAVGILGGAVGIERGSGDRPAGFRTHILVCVGSALIMLVSMYGFDDTYVSGISNANNRDSARIAAQVVSGIGFLGAGTIMHEGVTVRGLTTAASLWMVSAIGLAAGAGMYVLSFVSTAIMLITLVSFRKWEKRFGVAASNGRRYIRIVANNEPGIITNITSYLAENDIKVKTLNVKNNAQKNEVVLELYLKIGKNADKEGVARGLQSISGIITIENIG